MTQPDDRGARRSRAHQPARTARPKTRRGGDRRPWPTAPTTTKVSPARPGAKTRPRPAASTPTPATVWTVNEPVDLDASWPGAFVERIVTSFSEPDARVVLLPWPSPPTHAPIGAHGVIEHAPGAEPGPELDDAVHTVERLGRTARVEHLAVDPDTTAPTTRPFWADLVDNPRSIPAAVIERAPAADTDDIAGDADLVITSLRPLVSGDRAADQVALFAARLLRVGGILVVFTHCDWSGGELVDPTGAVVAAGQNADLLYLQHVVAVHTPVKDGRFPLDDGSQDEARTRHRAVVRGLPAPHRRIHSDIQVFAQPHEGGRR
ncbi:hypothetical protein [Actinokineospora pegani]|uniref:hypothetical protein n=1 Tax=Actinokineospora pegani TaxID=2654637 RepID=UPI0012EA833A|nr:hypothetical protein [Actinokineospora pegani]